MNFTYFIGIDISKNKLDLAVFKGRNFEFHKVIDNQKADIDQFIRSLVAINGFSMANTLFCMEYTGIYNNILLRCLHKMKGNICLESATHIQKSLGNIRGKNDKVDAIRIGEYAYKNREEIKLWSPKRDIVVKLEQLSVLRDRLIKAKTQLNVPLTEQKQFIGKGLYNLEKKLCQRTLNSIDADLDKVNREIEEIIQQDDNLSHLFGIITSVQAVGIQTATQIIIRTNEFRTINDAKKFACYCGVAPFTKESGMFKGRARISPMANKKLKTLLHMAALTAINHNTDMKHYYQRKVAGGKNKMSVINAVRNKLIHRIFTCVNQNREYENIYSKALA